MATSLYDLSVPTFLQTVRAVAGFLQRAATHCAETGADPDDLVHARLIADMAPFHFQIEALSHHSVWGLQAVKTGVFAPPALVGAMPFGGLRAMVDEAATGLEALTPAEVNGWARKALDIGLPRPPRRGQRRGRQGAGHCPPPPARRRRSLLGLGAATTRFHVGDFPPFLFAA